MAADKVFPVKTKYSIFLPVRNGQDYVAKAVESVLAQRFTDFMLIILENKSTDKTMSIVRSYDDSRITVIEAPRDLSIYESWHRIYELIGSGKVQSEFSTTLGHDDILYPEFLTTIDALVCAYPDASLYQTHFDIIGRDGKVLRPCKPIPTRESHKDFFLSRCWGNRDSYGTGYVFRTKDYLTAGGLKDMPLLLWSDDLLVIQLSRLSYKVCGGHCAFAYRRYKHSASGAINVKKFEAQIAALRRYLTEIKTHHADLITDDYDKITLGFLMAGIMDWYDFPLRRFLMGAMTAAAIEEIRIEALQLMQGRNFHELHQSHFLDRLYSKLRQFCVMMLYLFNNQKSRPAAATNCMNRPE